MSHCNNIEENVIFGTSNSIELATEIAKKTNIPFATFEKVVFADGEIKVKSNVVVRNRIVYIIFSGSSPVNENLMELFLFIDSLKRASAKEINVVLTYFPYARQDRKNKGRESIGAKAIADILERMGSTKIISIDLHNSSIQAFFDIPTDDLKGQFILAKELKKSNEKFTVASPDHGGAVRARQLAELISDSIKIAIVDKRRTGPNKSEIVGVLGEVEGKNIVIIDDIIDTGGTIIKAAEMLKSLGAKKIIVAATHGLFSNGFQIFEESEAIDRVIVTNSVATVNNLAKFKKLTIAGVEDLISSVIEANTKNESISKLYDTWRKTITNFNEDK
ncbi:ribose-phosphate diphosphokinase [[Mycoplasma] mobile]|uniref:ribose-phosphate diphosphokinase n=1 Tax=Mycoplasma mobile (strain ATCC 43663 / 163K / NCTC 11711) TaxID=267748 RepID=Q6KH78_MYCM1|nr:ribose-phosphate diphosphokinase [[Mycoplasma] mobile]AAT28052.1 phosphoribosylpyrophosphate synthetase [Mycoplasma mobile 163K]